MTVPARIAVAYLVVVCVVIAVVAVVQGLDTGPDASFAPVWAIAATLPGSLAIIWLPEVGPVAAFALLVGVAAVQALVIYLVARAVTRQRA